ncbi:hypothetical protein [Anabaena azotica]|uniref:Uncharacterized protein n=1 Tax=Anabaena azotica FACHB-119 TaxID=947527 RepID=A0ABR8D0Q3_9NOST|nr:hypothetical protein [Anabaena azotica]MBD2500770.1 hypothetical protein [Anabaena azotica FACHB-119]
MQLHINNFYISRLGNGGLGTGDWGLAVHRQNHDMVGCGISLCKVVETLHATSLQDVFGA